MRIIRTKKKNTGRNRKTTLNNKAQHQERMRNLVAKEGSRTWNSKAMRFVYT